MAAVGQNRQDSDTVNKLPISLSQSSLCDTHVHVFNQQRFAFAERRRFTPGYAGTDLLVEHLQRIGAGRAVLVQPSVYGNDHACLTDALELLHGRARGVAVLAPNSTAKEIGALDAAGFRATRVNLVVNGNEDVSAASDEIALAARKIPEHWHVQLHVTLPVLRALGGLIRRSSCHFVLDHMGLPPEEIAAEERVEWQELCELAASGKLSVKLSAPYLSSSSSERLTPLVLKLLSAAPRAVLWGTNWPHTQGTARTASGISDAIEPFRAVDDVAWLYQCKRWLAMAGLEAETLDDNAARLYDF